MNCSDVESVLGSGIAELPPEVTAHVESCPGCAEAYSQEMAFEKLLHLAATVQVEPADRVWHQIDARLRRAEPRSQWDALAGRVRALFEMPDLRPAWVTLALALVVSGAVIGLRSPAGDDPALAELRSFELEVPENPFLPEPGGHANPFYGWGGQLQ